MSKGQRLTMHGRDHRPGGADPIPALASLGIEYTYVVSNSTITVPGDELTEVAFDFQGGLTGLDSPALTNATDVFEIAPFAASSGPFAGKHGLNILEDGIYLVFLEVRVASPDESTDNTPNVQHIGWTNEGGVFQMSEFIYSGHFDKCAFGVQAITQLWQIYGGTTLMGLSVTQGRGTSVDLRSLMVVARLDRRDTSSLGVLF